MKKSRIKTIIIAVSVIAFLVYLVLVIGINLKYPKAQLEEKQLGEAMTADDFEITATDADRRESTAPINIVKMSVITRIMP